MSQLISTPVLESNVSKTLPRCRTYCSPDEQVKNHRKQHRQHNGQQQHHEASGPAAERADLHATDTHEMLSLARRDPLSVAGVVLLAATKPHQAWQAQ